MTAPWIVAVVCLWVLVLGLVVVVAGVLRRVASVLEAQAAESALTGRHDGPTTGEPLPGLEVEQTDGGVVRLSDLEGPFVLAIFNSHCEPCREVAEWLSANEGALVGLVPLMVLTDAEGRDGFGLGGSVVLTDESGLAVRGLNVPGTPFAIAVGADGRVTSATLLAGPEHLLRLARPSAISSPGSGSGVEGLTILHRGVTRD